MQADGPVVIALDGTPRSESTLIWGVDEAAARGAAVLLVRVFRDPTELMAWSWYPLVADVLGLADEARSYLSQARDRALARHPGLAVQAQALEGSEVPVLRDLSEQAQLLVVGAGKPGDRVRTGSVTFHLAAHGRCPVAVVRSEPDSPQTGAVVVGVDGSQASISAARTAADEAALHGERLLVLHAHPTIPDPFGRAMPTPEPVPSLDDPDDPDPIHRAVRRTVEVLRELHPGLQVDVRMVDDDPGHALVTAGENARMVVVGSRGLGAFRGMLLGSVSNDVVRTASCTVLVLHDSTH